MWAIGYPGDMDRYTNPLLDQLVGRQTLLRYLIGPPLDHAYADRMAADTAYVRERAVRTRAVVIHLDSYDHVGIVARIPAGEASGWYFVPWGAVLELSGWEPLEE